MSMTESQKDLWKEYVTRKVLKANIAINDLNKVLEWVMENRNELIDDVAMQNYVDTERSVEQQNALDAAKALLEANGKTIVD